MAKIDQGIIWYLPEMQNLRFMRAQYVQHSFKPHAHDYFVLGIIETGLQSFTYKKERLITAPGNLIIINPDELHTGEAAIPEGFTYRALYPTINIMNAIIQEFSANSNHIPLFEGGTIQDPQLFAQIKYLHRQTEIRAAPLELESQLIHFFVRLIQRHASQNFTLKHYQNAHHAIRQICDYLEANYAQNVSLSDLSNLVHISPYHLTRLFHRHMAMPPHKYLENIRIRHAEHLLTDGLGIAEVAFATGFSSQSHLTRTFKQFLGTTPGEFVK